MKEALEGIADTDEFPETVEGDAAVEADFIDGDGWLMDHQ